MSKHGQAIYFNDINVDINGQSVDNDDFLPFDITIVRFWRHLFRFSIRH